MGKSGPDLAASCPSPTVGSSSNTAVGAPYARHDRSDSSVLALTRHANADRRASKTAAGDVRRTDATRRTRKAAIGVRAFGRKRRVEATESRGLEHDALANAHSGREALREVEHSCPERLFVVESLTPPSPSPAAQSRRSSFVTVRSRSDSRSFARPRSGVLTWGNAGDFLEAQQSNGATGAAAREIARTTEAHAGSHEWL
jgi:hypothetical protein